MKLYDEEDIRAWGILKKDRTRLTKLVVLVVISLAGLPTAVALLTQQKPLECVLVCLVGMLAATFGKHDLDRLIKEAEVTTK